MLINCNFQDNVLNQIQKGLNTLRLRPSFQNQSSRQPQPANIFGKTTQREQFFFGDDQQLNSSKFSSCRMPYAAINTGEQVKFTTNQTLMAITASSTYSNQSFEEMRYADYGLHCLSLKETEEVRGSHRERYSPTYECIDAECRLLSITAMTLFCEKSFEEIRLENYVEAKKIPDKVDSSVGPFSMAARSTQPQGFTSNRSAVIKKQKNVFKYDSDDEVETDLRNCRI